MCHRDRETDRQRERETDWQRHREGETERGTETEKRVRERQTDRETETQRERDREAETDTERQSQTHTERQRQRQRESDSERERERVSQGDRGRKNILGTYIMLQNVQDAAWNETSHPKLVHVYLLSHRTIPAIRSNNDIHNKQLNHIFTQSLYL